MPLAATVKLTLAPVSTEAPVGWVVIAGGAAVTVSVALPLMALPAELETTTE